MNIQTENNKQTVKEVLFLNQQEWKSEQIDVVVLYFHTTFYIT